MEVPHRCWDDQYVVFIPGSGDTVLLTATAWQVLVAICAENNGISLSQLLAELDCSEFDEDLVSLLQRTIEQFESLQLIERLSVC
jgi:PqqD family protein of HPr-rel-A system